MATKIDNIQQLAEQTAERITSSTEEWLAFCRSASNLYRMPFGDQLLVYAQRPDAKQCASMDFWNKNLKCYVNKGAKGIALMGENNRIRYVFDMSDVHKVSEKSLMPYQWEVSDDARESIVSALERKYDLIFHEGNDLGDRLVQIAEKVSADVSIDMTSTADSGLSEVFETEREGIANEAITASIASMLLTRCGLDPSDYALTGLQYISMFNTPDSVYELGTATADAIKPVLISIEKEMHEYERNNRNLQNSRGLSDSELGKSSDIGSRLSDGDIRVEETELSEGKSEGTVRKAEIDRAVAESSDDDRSGRIESETVNSKSDDEVGRSEQTASGEELSRVSEEVTDDKPGSRQTGDRGDRNDLTVVITDKAPRMAKPDPTKKYLKLTADTELKDVIEKAKSLNPADIQVDSNLLTIYPSMIPEYNSIREASKAEGFTIHTLIDLRPREVEVKEITPEVTETGYEQLSFDMLPSMGEQIAQIEKAESSAVLDNPSEEINTVESPIWSVVDDILRTGGGHDNSREHIYAKYVEHKTPAEMAELLKDEYKTVGKGFTIDGKKYAVWFNEEGMSLSEGTAALDAPDYRFSWETVESRVRNMVESGTYMSAWDAEQVFNTEYTRVASGIYYFFRDGMDDFPKTLGSGSNFPDSVERIKVLLDSKLGRSEIANELAKAQKALESGEAELRWKHVKSPEFLLNEVADLDTARVSFPLSESVDIQKETFITDDSIDRLLCGGSGVSEGKFRIFEQFAKNESRKDNIAFLKNEYGIGGRSHALVGHDNSWEDHDAKGIALSVGSIMAPTAKVTLSWAEVEKRLSRLIASEQYLTPGEKEELAKRMSSEVDKQADMELDNILSENDVPFPEADGRISNQFEDKFADAIRQIKLKEGVDSNIAWNDGRSIDISWHEPSGNVGYYPIVNLDKGNTQQTLEGGENPESWQHFIHEIADSIDGKDTAKDFQFDSPFASISIDDQKWVYDANEFKVGDIVELPAQMMTNLKGKEVLIPTEKATITKIGEGSDHQMWVDFKSESGALTSSTFSEIRKGGYLIVGHDDSFDRPSIEEDKSLVGKALVDDLRDNSDKHSNIYKIYQLKSSEELPNRRDIAFEGYDYLLRRNLLTCHEDFNLIYAGQITEFNSFDDRNALLEKIWTKYNTEHPEDYPGYSLSVGDVIGIVEADGTEKFYFCDSVGFEPYPEFEMSREQIREFGAEKLKEEDQEIAAEIGLPNIKLEWSESPYFEGGKIYSVKEFDEIMHEADLSRANTKLLKIAEYGSYDNWRESGDSDYWDIAGYDKVKFTVNFKDGTSESHRQDVGDGIGGILEFANYYMPDHLDELIEAAGRPLDPMRYQLVTNLLNDPTASGYSKKLSYRTYDEAVADGNDFIRSHDGYGIYDMKEGKCVLAVGEFDEEVPVKTNILGLDFKEDYYSHLDFAEKKDNLMDLKVGDRLVDKDGVLWTVKDNGWMLSLEKAPENLVDTLASSRAYTSWQRQITEHGTFDEWANFRKITVEEYLSKNAEKTLTEVADDSIIESFSETKKTEPEIFYYISDGAEFNEDLFYDRISDFDELKELLYDKKLAEQVKSVGINIPSVATRVSISNHNRVFLDVIEMTEIANNKKAMDMVNDYILDHPELELYDDKGEVKWLDYAHKVCPFQVLMYSHEAGYDEGRDFKTLEEAFKESNRLLKDGYEGTAIINLQDKEVLDVSGAFDLQQINHDYTRTNNSERISEQIDNNTNANDEVSLDTVDFAHLSKRFDEHYKDLAESDVKKPGYDSAVNAGDAFIKKNPNFMGAFNMIRGDVVSSDRETAALGFALAELGITKPLDRNFRITDENLGIGGPKEKFRRNIEAIKTLKLIESEGREATEDEKQILSQYVGWGGLAQAFDRYQWNSEYYELQGLLTTEEYNAARASTTEAFYTSPAIISGIYDTLERMGFEGGNVLEPSCGVGNFFGVMPESLRNSKLYGVELDSISGRIAQKLYPDANIQINGYEKTNFANGAFDVAVGNVPFADVKPYDPIYKKQNFLIHDYFFAKTLDKVRPGGVIAFVTSTGTMDKADPSVRQYLANRAELIGAVRLPGGANGAFKANAGTEASADILFLKKRDSVIEADEPWIYTGYTEDGIPVNEYFVDHPEMMVGKMEMVSGRFGSTPLCVADTSRPFKEQLDEVLSQIEGNYEPKQIEVEKPDAEKGEIPSVEGVRNFSYAVVDDKIYYRDGSVMRPALNAQGKPLNKKMQEQVKGMIGLRDSVRQLLDAQVNDAPDETIKELQTKLNDSYDAYIKKYGRLNSNENRLRFGKDESMPLLLALEVFDEDTGEFVRKADIFTKRTIEKAVPVTNVETASEALTVCLNEMAKVDLDRMSELCHKPKDEVIEDLRGIIFKNPTTSEWETAEQYLSGNIRSKLAIAKNYAVDAPEYALNVQALEAVMPEELSASDIEVRLGSTWIDSKYINQFMEEMMDTPSYMRRKINSRFIDFTAEWKVDGKNEDPYNAKVHEVFGTPRRNGYQILEDALNLKPSEVYDTYIEDGKQKRTINREETILAQQKQDALKEAFKDWIFADPDRRNDLVKKYNELFNSNRPRTFSGSHLSLPGSNKLIELKDHQKDGVARILYGGNTLLAHCVGAGKTFTMVAGAMESKRLGLCKKSMFVVPNHLTEQWGSDFRQLYPNANILVIRKDDFSSPEKRKKFTARIATGDYDAVIIGHSTFKKISLSPDKLIEFQTTQLNEYRQAQEELKLSGASRQSIKDIEKAIKGVESKIEKLLNSRDKDTHISFEELGIDRLFVDESHAYKNLFFPTKMSRIPGVNTAHSQAAEQMLSICRYMDEKTGGKGVTFATGTPIANSMTELYTNMTYLQNGMLKSLGLNHFDKWASTFGETTTAMEVTPTGTGYQAKTRFAKFFNLPELMSIFKESADIRTQDMLNLPVPKVEYEDVVLEKSVEQQAILDAIDKRATKIKTSNVDPTVDNMLKITNDGRKMALDQKLINSALPDNPNSKSQAVADNAYEIYKQTMDSKGTQLIFSDLGTPGKDKEFDVYNEIKDKLIAKGVPENEIAFVHDFDKDKDKQKLFGDVRRGKIRFLLGSTQKMGAGTNVQNKLIALHHVDVPWRPADLEQQEGRILRRGNENPRVKIFRYITKGTFDAYNWQTIEHKQAFISQIMTSKSPVRSHDDIDDSTLAYAAVKALCADNPLIAEKMELDVDIQKLQIAKSAYKKQIYNLQDMIAQKLPQQIAQSKTHIEGFKADIETYNDRKPKDPESFKIMVLGKVYTDKKEGAEALQEAIRSKTDIIGDFRPIGEYQGFKISTSFDIMHNSYKMKLVGESAHFVDDVAKDPLGTITRMNNVLENMPKILENHINNLNNAEKQLVSAKEEVTKPFPKEAELAEKQARVSEINAELKMDEKGENIIIGSQASDFKNVVKEINDEEELFGEKPSEQQKAESEISVSEEKPQERDKIKDGKKVNLSALTKDNPDSISTSKDAPEKSKDRESL